MVEFRLGSSTSAVQLSDLNVVGQTDLLFRGSGVLQVAEADGIVDVLVARDRFPIASVGITNATLHSFKL